MDDWPESRLSQLWLDQVATYEEFTESLVAAREFAGTPSHRTLAAKMAAQGSQVSMTTLSRILAGERKIARMDLVSFLRACGLSETQAWEAAWERVALSRPQSVFNIVNSGTGTVITGSNASVDVSLGDKPPLEPEPDLATQRQSFFFKFLQQALRQAETTFRLSVIFMSAGAIILLTGGILALMRVGTPPWSYLPLLTGLSGLLITTCGGAFALHSNRARKHLTEQAERIHQNIQSDHTLGQALDLIDRVDDAELRDRLKSITAMRVLGMSPEPNEVTQRLLPQQGSPTREIEGGSPEEKPSRES